LSGKGVITKKKASYFLIAGLLEVDFIEINGEIRGDFFLELTRDGKNYSTTRGSGKNTYIKQIPGKNNELIIKIGPDTYFQFIYVPLLDQFIANYYNKFKHIGLASLRRL